MPRADNESKGEAEIRFEGRQLTSVADLVGFVVDDAQALGEPADELAPPVWYRGQPNAGHQLLPTMGREPEMLRHERVLLNRFKQNAHQMLERQPESEWDWLFLARHHGLESRLLDWSESPLIGLYFAVSDFAGPAGNAPYPGDEATDGALWCLLPTLLNDGRFSQGEIDIPMFEDETSGLDAFLPRSVELSFGAEVQPVAGLGMRKLPRMQSQQGVFTIMHSRAIPIEEARDDGLHVWRYTIPSDGKERIRNELSLLGLRPLTVFPELDNVALAARRSTGG